MAEAHVAGEALVLVVTGEGQTEPVPAGVAVAVADDGDTLADLLVDRYGRGDRLWMEGAPTSLLASSTARMQARRKPPMTSVADWSGVMS